MFCSSRKELKLNIFTKKDTMKDKNIIISSLKKILKIRDTFFELIKIEVECPKIYFKIFSHKKLDLLETT